MKNVKVIFTDTDYELVAKAYKQYDKVIIIDLVETVRKISTNVD